MKAFAILTLALLAGCLGGSGGERSGPDGMGPIHREPETPDEPDPQPRAPAPPATRPSVTFGDPIVLGRVPGDRVGAVASTPDGTHVLLSGGALWRSLDGQAWSPVHGTGCPMGMPACTAGQEVANYPPVYLQDLVATPDGLHGIGTGARAVQHFTSDDEGSSWAEGEVMHDQAGVPALTWQNESLVASWREINSFGAARLDENGLWGVVAGAPAGIHLAGAVVASPNGHLLVPLQTESGFEIRAAVHGETGNWEMRGIHSGGAETHRAAQAAVDANGTFYVVWAYDTERELGGAGWQAGSWMDASHVFLSVSLDDGATFSEPVRLNPPGTSAMLPSIAAAGPGNVVVAWLQSPVGPAYPVDAAWQVMAAVASNADLNQTLVPQAVSTEPANAGLTCTAGSLCPPWATGAGLDVGVGIDAAGHATIAWHQETPGDPHVTSLVSRVVAEPGLWTA